MPPLKFTEVLSFSSEDPNHPADNLLRPDTFRKWKCATGLSDKQAYVILKLEKLSSIHSIDIGNDGAAFVEVLGGREGVDFQVLLVASSFMTPGESRNGTNLNRVRMFSPDKLNKNVAEQKWDRLKVICTQPFNKNVQYGLSFITANASSEGSSDSTPKGIRLGSFTLKEEEESDPISVGSMFARRKEPDATPLTGAAAIRAASTAASSSNSSSPSTDENKLKQANAPDVGFYQIKKNASLAVDQTKTPPSSKPSSDRHKEKVRESEKREKERDFEKNKEKDKERKRKDTENREEKGKDKHKKDKSHERDKKSETSNRKDPDESKKKQHENSKQTPSSSSGASSRRKSAPFKSLMKDVSFVLSGYQNPQRSQIRDMMTEMGARYKSDWDPSCSHLICAFTNTPKYQQVRGKGRIITAKWTFDCHKNKIRYPCKRYSLEKTRNDEDSEEEIWAEELLPKEDKPKSTPNTTASANDEPEGGEDSGGNYSDDEDTDDEIERVLAQQKMKNKTDSSEEKKTKTNIKPDPDSEEPASKKIKTEISQKQNAPLPKVRETDKDGLKMEVDVKMENKADVKMELNGTEDTLYDDDTDVDEENKEHVMRPDTSSISLPSLGDYLKGKSFFIYGKMSADVKHLLSRYIIAFDGMLEDYMNQKVNFVVTEDEWDDNFDDALSDNSSLQFVKPSWIWRCSDRQKLVPFQPFMVVPRE